jgi:glutamine amidotransferase
MNVAIIDYGMGNLFSIQRACACIGLRGIITSDKKTIAGSSGLILPGVGAFPDAMRNLRDLDLVGIIKDQIGIGKPFLGICLGMQLLFTESEEFGVHEGLDVIKGMVTKFGSAVKNGDGVNFKVPQVGWNRIYFKKKTDLLEGVEDGEYMYFVHSYYALNGDPEASLTTTRYENTEYGSSYLKDSVFATQFHPEKSGPPGLRIYRNWAQRVLGYGK